MKRAIQRAITLIVSLLMMHLSLSAQATAPRGTGCKECHECDIPTKLNPCLKKCPRGQMITVHASASSGPAEVVMNAIEGNPDVYEPVRFAHRAHASMAEMSGGCARCHHYNLTGAVLACKTCHEPGQPSKTSDLSKPGLKGAYHRQCVNCHRESGLDTKCDGSCHRAKASASKTPLAVVDTKHEARVTRPDRFVYESGYAGGKVVTFFHNDHSARFGLECSSCHVNEACSTCHKSATSPPKPAGHLKGGHDRCSSCHSVTENCTKCHDTQPRAQFDHGRKTRFDLGRFHASLSCDRCHKGNSGYKGLSPNCSSCHSAWKPGAFDHTVTGMKLSETHAALDCESCHLESNFAGKPACNGCHDDKSYPTALPGVRSGRSKPAKR
jgi:hypothetical protein